MSSDSSIPWDATLSQFISSNDAASAVKEDYDPLRFEQYPWMGFVAFMCLYVGSIVIDAAFKRFSPKLYRSEMSHNKQRICVTYVAEIVVTTIAFGYNLSCGIPALTGDMESMTVRQFQHFRFTGTMITLIYIWELIYRLSMGTPLLVHHLLTVLLIQAFVLDAVNDMDLTRLRQVIFLLFTATSEQSSFLALLCHRFKLYRWAMLFFYIAMVSSFLIKSMIYFFGLYLFASSDYIKERSSANDTFWMFGWVPITTALYASQVYACYILYSLGNRSQRRLQGCMDDEDPVDREESGKEGGEASTRNVETTGQTREEIITNLAFKRGPAASSQGWSMSSSHESQIISASSVGDTFDRIL